MKARNLLIALAVSALTSSGAVMLHAQNIPPAVTAAVNDPARPQADKDRDKMRRPAEMLAASGVKQGDKVIELAPAGGYVTRLLSKLVDSGVMIGNPSCGFCTGFQGVLAAGERCIAAAPRNFRGRMGSNEAEIFLGSPATVTASAIRGEIVDPREVM